MQVTGNNNNHVPLAQLFQIAAAADANLGRDVATGQTAVCQIKVVALQPFAEQLLEEEQIFIAQSVAADASNGRSCLLQLSSHHIQRLSPACCHQLAIPPHQRLGQPVSRLGKMMHKAVFIRNPNLIHRLMLARHHPLNHAAPTRFGFAPRANRHVAAGRTMGR